MQRLAEMKPSTFALGLALIAALPQAASAQSIGDFMSGKDIAATFNGVAIEGRYGDERAFHERYRETGRVEYRERGLTSGGKWSVEADTLCTIYDGDAAGGCFRVKKVSGNCYEFFFVARTEIEAHRDPRKPAWTARGSIVGGKGACQEESTV